MNLNKLLFLLFLSGSVVAQDIGTTKVKVLEGYKPAIPEAVKLNENANFEDTLKKDRVQVYEFIDVDLESEYTTKPLTVAKVKNEKITDLYSNKVSASLGSAWISRASLVYNSCRSNNFSYGLMADHFSNRYYFAKNSDNHISLYTKKIGSSNIFVSNLFYERKTSLYYDDKSNLEDKFFRNRYAYTKFSFSASSNKVIDNTLKHHTVFFISDLNELSENQIHFRSNLRKKISGVPVVLDVRFDNYMRYNNIDSNLGNRYFRSLYCSPNTSFSRFGIDFDLGIDIDLRSNSSASFFPVFQLTKELVEDVLLINGGLRHKKKNNSLKSLSDVNPYVHSFGTNQSILRDSIILQQLKVTDIHDWFLYMRNILGWQDVLELGIAYGKVQNFTHFIPFDYLDYNRFQAVYLDVNQLHICARYSRRINEIMSLDAEVDYFNWNKTVYYSPHLTSNLSVFINLREKVRAKPSISYMGRRFITDQDLTGLPSQIHVNLELYYLYSKQLSAYLELNNLSNSKQDMWLGYREIGFHVVFGMNFSF
tara:strand:+ start:11226 stop:12833 length:1608 start_codon:yes stop_codon:yes gene_type:complete